MESNQKIVRKGFIVFLVPESGLFLRRGVFYDGSGKMDYQEPQAMRIHPTRAQAETFKAKRLREFAKIYDQRFSAKVLSIEYTLMPSTRKGKP